MRRHLRSFCLSPRQWNEDLVEVEVRIQLIERTQYSLRRHVEDNLVCFVEIHQYEVVLDKYELIGQVVDGEALLLCTEELVEVLRDRADDCIVERLTDSDLVSRLLDLNVAVVRG